MTPPCPNPCGYYDQDGVVCNEEPNNCPKRQAGDDPQASMTERRTCDNLLELDQQALRAQGASEK